MVEGLVLEEERIEEQEDIWPIWEMEKEVSGVCSCMSYLLDPPAEQWMKSGHEDSG